MKITSIRIDGYGVWKELELGELSDQVTLFYGPNEAGKTTLMQFVRGLFYGFSAERRQRYLPPLRGGTPGGAMSIRTAEGQFEVARRLDRARPNGDVVVTAPDGTQQGEPALAALLSGIDESIFSNLYAFGLREIQELGTLSDTEAARHLYELTAGLDRISLVDVQRELAASQQRLLSADDRPSHIGRLLSERERLLGAIETSRTGLSRYNRLLLERAGLDRELAQAENERRELDGRTRVAELAVTLRGKWLERSEVAAQLASLGPVAELPERAIERLEELNRRIAARRKKQAAQQRRRRDLRVESRSFAVNEALWRQAARIEALCAQHEWVVSVEAQLAADESEAAELESQIASLNKRLGIDPALAAAWSASLPSKSQKALRPAARALAVVRQRRTEARRAAEAAEAEAQTADRDMAARLSAAGEKDLAAAMEKSGGLASQFRRRMQLDERITQMGHQQTELTEQGHALLQRQILPANVLIGLGAVFAVGTLLVLVGLFMPASVVGNFGWGLALLGLAGGGASGAGKFLLERAAARDLDSNQKQLNMLSLQLKQAQEERDELDRRLPRGGGPLAARLQSAERSLAAMEELLPLDAKRQMAQRDSQAARARLADLEEPYRAARRGWRKVLQAMGLPKQLTPRQTKRLGTAGDELSSLQARLIARRQQAQQRQRELLAYAERVARLAADGGVEVEDLNTAARLDCLAAAAAEQESLVRRRDELRQAARAARKAAQHHGRRAARHGARIRTLLRDAGAESQDEFRRRVLLCARHQVLVRQHAALSADIVAALGNVSSEEELDREFKDSQPQQLEKRWEGLSTRCEAVAARLKELYQQRGRLDEQVLQLAADRGPAELRLELATVCQQLREAVARWQELAVIGLLLDEIRITFERDRQPATLQEASEYLGQLTGGHYPRVWTPLGQSRLLVDDAAGNSLSPEMLSRGTREQLFLALRLALVTRYAERGIELPLVLDDVLVNFDAARARAAARVLRNFARAGHQLLVFTCHEHMVKVFKALKVETRLLPDNAGSENSVPAETRPTVKTAGRRRPSPPAKMPVAAPDEVEVEDADEDADDNANRGSISAIGDDVIANAKEALAGRSLPGERRDKPTEAEIQRILDGEDRDELDDEFDEADLQEYEPLAFQGREHIFGAAPSVEGPLAGDEDDDSDYRVLDIDERDVDIEAGENFENERNARHDNRPLHFDEESYDDESYDDEAEAA